MNILELPTELQLMILQKTEYGEYLKRILRLVCRHWSIIIEMKKEEKSRKDKTVRIVFVKFRTMKEAMESECIDIFFWLFWRRKFSSSNDSPTKYFETETDPDRLMFFLKFCWMKDPCWGKQTCFALIKALFRTKADVEKEEIVRHVTLKCIADEKSLSYQKQTENIWKRKIEYFENNRKIAEFAIEIGCTSILAHLKDKGHPFSEHLTFFAMEKEKSGILRWLLERKCPIEKFAFQHAVLKRKEKIVAVLSKKK